MNKVSLSLAAAALLINAGTAFAASEAKVYGKVNVSLNNVDIETDEQDEWRLNSNASRLGVKGKHTINDNLDAIFKMEFEASVDDGDKKGQTLSQRNIYGGLKGNFGTIIAGKHDTPLKRAQGKIDRFNDLELGDIKNVLSGEDRVSNIIMYTTPKMEGFSATFALVPGEESEADAGADEDARDGLADGTSFSFNYKNDMFTAALARNDDIKSLDTTRLAFDVKLAKAKVGLLYQTSELSEGEGEEDGFVISTQVKVTKDIALKAQYTFADANEVVDNEEVEVESTQLALGIDKKLNKNNKLFAYYSNIESEGEGETLDDSTFAIGYEIKF